MRASFRHLFALGAVLLCSAGVAAHGEGMLVRRVIGKATAKPQTSLAPGASFGTGAHSKSELSVPGGVVRTGEQAQLQTLPHGLSLERGVSLVAAQPGTLRRSIEVRAPGYRVKVRGTAQVAYQPGRALKVVVLEGSVTVALDSVAGEFETLRPGQMLVIDPSDHRLPEPVEIDLQRLVATSALVNGEFGALATASQIAAAGTGQGRAYDRGDLTPTPLLLRGVDNALLVQERVTAARIAATNPVTPQAFERGLFNGTNDLDQPGVVTNQRTFLFADRTSGTSNLGTTTFARDALNVGQTHTLNINVTPHFSLLPGGLQGFPDGRPTISGRIRASEDFFASNGGTLLFTSAMLAPRYDRLLLLSTADVQSPDGVGLRFDAVRGMDSNGATLTAGAGGALTVYAANRGITIQQQSKLKGDSISVSAKPGPLTRVLIDQSTLTANHRLTVGDATFRTGVTIQNSSQLSVIAGNLSLLANRAGLTVKDSTLQSKKGTAFVDAYIRALTDSSHQADTTAGIVSLQNVQLMAQAIRVRGFSNNGDALIIDGSTFSAPQLIKLYAEGVSTLRFRNTVDLNTNLAILAGKTVEVDAGGAVRISGKGRVYTDQANYNQGGFGSITAHGGLIQSGFDSRPSFSR